MKKKHIYKCLVVIGFLLIAGVAGGSDTETISDTTYWIFAILGLSCFGFGAMKLDEQEEEDNLYDLK